MKKSKSYLFQSFVILLMATGFFYVFKTYLPKRIFSDSTVKTDNIVVDSLLLKAMENQTDSIDSISLDSINNNDTLIDSDSTAVVISTEPDYLFKGFVYLQSFYERLYQLEKEQKGKVRIAYYGDSMTDGDLIVQDLRRSFQNKYGGEGVGFVSITSESASSRASIVHRFSKNWKRQTYLKANNPLKPFGVDGNVNFSNDTVNTTWVKYKASFMKHLNNLNSPVLFYGKSNNMNGQLRVVIGKDTIIKNLKPVSELNSLIISNNNLKEFKADFISADSIPIYGFNFANSRGVHIDNFSSRGNSGLPLSILKTGLMNKFQQKLDYQLIVLHYGANVLSTGTHNYNWYAKRMERVVQTLKNNFPGAEILVISTADKATKYDLAMQTDSAVVPLVNAQRKYAISGRTAFVNLYELMGGEGSMVRWVEEEPSKANKDYTHFNHRGAKAASDLIFEQLEQGYELFKIQKEKEIIEKERIEKELIEEEEVSDSLEFIINDNLDVK